MTVAQLAQERTDRRRLVGLVVALGVLMAATLAWGIPHIEDELTTTVERTLAEHGWSDVTVEFSGRDARLFGTTNADPEEVAGAVAALDGVRTVRLELRPADSSPDTTVTAPAPALGEPLVTLAVSPDPSEPGRQTVALGGTVPSELVIQLAMEAASAIAGDGTVINTMEVAPTRDALWLTRLDTILGALDGAGDITVILGSGRAVVEGTVTSAERLEQIRTAMVGAVEPELDLAMEVDVAASLSPAIELATDGDSLEISGQLPDDALAVVETLAEQVFGPEVALNVTTEGVADAPWLDPLWGLVPQLDKAADLRIVVNATGVDASGAVASIGLLETIESSLTTVAELAEVELNLDVRFDVAAAARLCPPEELNRLVAEGGVLFASNSAALTDSGIEALDQVASLLEGCDGVVVEVGGHTDDIGDADYNQFLSEQRALAVVEYLVEQGVDPDRLVAVGYGETRPIADNATSEGRALNRRIEFTLLGGE